jgi:endonuclease G, mitochondrial
LKPSDPEQTKAVRAAVRQVADDYLRDPNINSVGLGFKTVHGQATDDLALQFTVDRKLAPDALEATRTRPIPATITANGFTFKTDVLERTFELHPVAVARATKSKRTQRRNPMEAGISVGNFRETAGTLGCVVKDIATGEILMLSNWHVLQGPEGQLGDTILQPGPSDDNRVALNGAGSLVRSFVGLAGDCALARPVNRALVASILGLDGVAVRGTGDPEVGDAVVKSGRTTGVTHGRVTRIHTITKFTYGALGQRSIGSFEIGPDSSRPPETGEICAGGDSGSAWLAVGADGATSNTMVGLHVAGERQAAARYAVACYASAVFEQLEISPLEEPARTDDVAPAAVTQHP